MRNDWVDAPANDGDIDGIYRYLAWHMTKAGLSSTCFHYLEVLKKAAESPVALAAERKARDSW